MTVYLDIVFLENIVINYIIIYLTGIISRIKIKQRKIILGSLVGAIYSVIYYVFRIEIYSGFIVKIILSIILIYISFNSKNLKELSKQVLLFYLVSFVFGGAAIAIIYMVNSQNITIQNGVLVGNYTIKTILIGVVIAYFTVIVAFNIIKTKLRSKDLICEISVKINNNYITTKAMIDTGNQLKEPITNIPVIIMEHTILYDYVPKEILDNLENILGGDLSGLPKELQDQYAYKLRVIPFSSLGKQNGMLLGIKGEELIIELENERKTINKFIIGIYDKSLTKRGEYRALIGLDILN